MISRFTPAEKAMHYPKDRSFFVRIKPYMLFIIGMVLLGSIAIAWIQYLIFGLPHDLYKSMGTFGSDLMENNS